MGTEIRRGRALTRVSRAVAVAACVATVLLSAGSGASAHGAHGADSAHGADRAEAMGDRSGWHGPVVTRPAQPDIDYPRGEVCPFPVKARFPVVDMTQKTWTDDDGNPVFAIVSGPLVVDATNLDTGKTVRRDISGTGTYSYPEPGTSTRILSGGDWAVGFRSADRPVHNKWLISRGFMSVRVTESNGTTQRELLELDGRYEDLCKTLAGRGGGSLAGSSASAD